MIPYVEGVVQIMGETYPLFGMFFAVAIYLSIYLATQRITKLGITEGKAFLWCVYMAFLAIFMSHAFAILFYRPELLVTEGLIVFLKYWDGMSSVGGFVGAIIGVIHLARHYNFRILSISDIVIISSVPGLTIGRIGCTFAHDHLGHITNFILAINYGAISRHNLGLYEFVFLAVVILPTSQVMSRRKLPCGRASAVIGVLYCSFRFCMDFFRANDLVYSDNRYWGFTTAQIVCLLLFIVSSSILYAQRDLKSTKPKLGH